MKVCVKGIVDEDGVLAGAVKSSSVASPQRSVLPRQSPPPRQPAH